MANFSMSVKMEGDEQPTVFPVKPRIVLAFERHFKTGMGTAFTKEPKMEHQYWLAWECMRTSTDGVKPFEKWLDTVDEVEIVPKEDDEAA